MSASEQGSIADTVGELGTAAPSTPRFADLEVGTELPSLTVTVTRPQMFLFSAATLNPHRIHYDRSWAVDVEGLPDIVVHGPLHGALMTRVVTDWMGPDAQVVRYAVRHSRPGFPDEEIRFSARVVATHPDPVRPVVDVEVVETNAHGQKLGSASISVALPGEEDAA